MLLTNGASHPSSTMWEAGAEIAVVGPDIAVVGACAAVAVGAIGAGLRAAEIAAAIAGAWAGAIFFPLSVFFETRLAVRLGGAVVGAEGMLSSRMALRVRLGLGVASSN